MNYLTASTLTPPVKSKALTPSSKDLYKITPRLPLSSILVLALDEVKEHSTDS
jgi:hypothetical protein